MPTDIHTILLLPHDPAMLAGGPWGAEPPTAHECDWCDAWGPGYCQSCRCDTTNHLGRTALVLAHDGEFVEQARGWVPHGVDRRVRILCGSVIDSGTTAGVRAGLARGLAVALDELGTIILLDANGREVTP